MDLEVHWMGPSRGIFHSWMMKTLNKVTRSNQETETKSFIFGTIFQWQMRWVPHTCTLTYMYMYTVLLRIKVSTIVNGCDSTLLFLVVSRGTALIHTLHTSLGVIWGLEIWAIQGMVIIPCFAHFLGYNLGIAQPIHGLLHKAWIPGLCRTTHGLSQSVLCG